MYFNDEIILRPEPDLRKKVRLFFIVLFLVLCYIVSMKIELDQLTEIKTNRFVTEASDIGIRAGVKWPTYLTTTMGNGKNLEYYCHEIEFQKEGDLLSVSYKQIDGDMIVDVLND